MSQSCDNCRKRGTRRCPEVKENGKSELTIQTEELRNRPGAFCPNSFGDPECEDCANMDECRKAASCPWEDECKQRVCE